ncbi:MAG: ATP synthase F1 subunit delta [Acidimicrobiia bacterium]
MVKSSVARRYARALFELLDPGSVASTRAGLADLGAVYSTSPELKHVLVSPAFGVEQKQSVLAALSRKAGCPSVVDGFLAQLVKKNRTGCLPDIADAFAFLADQAKGTQQVTVCSAKALGQAEQEDVRRQLRALLKQDVDLTFQRDTHLLAGMQIKIGSTVVDGTVRSRLMAIQSRLTRE